MRAHVARRGDLLECRWPLLGEGAVGDALERWYRRRARVRSRRGSTPPSRGRRGYNGSPDTRAAHPLGQLLVNGAMSFNWRLLLAPSEILEYVVEHEVAHLEVHDHSRALLGASGLGGGAVGRHEPGCAATGTPEALEAMSGRGGPSTT